MKIRILPLIVFFALISVFIKINNSFFDSGNIIDFTYNLALAQEDEEPKKEEAVWSENATKPGNVELGNISQMEKEILENLSKRRQELQEWSDSISMKENILNATEKKINRKIEELKELQDRVSKLLDQYNTKENRKIKRLVKIYETMKPKNAATIFNNMEIDILLDIVDNMKEASAANILAKMDVAKAQIITLQLAKRKKLSDK